MGLIGPGGSKGDNRANGELGHSRPEVSLATSAEPVLPDPEGGNWLYGEFRRFGVSPGSWRCGGSSIASLKMSVNWY